jgi:1-aminocyclopropane-1-carboxylate deaminase
LEEYRETPTTSHTFKGVEFYLKRDDLLDPRFNGNKARKLYYYLENSFSGIDTIVSHGSNQSNAMYSLSELCKLKNFDFIYYVDHIPSTLSENPNGNHLYSLQNGMQLRVADINNHNFKSNEIFIPEGGAIEYASYGIKILADEIKEWIKKNGEKNINIFLPSGTGTTALYLQKYLDNQVFTTPCVGDSNYLKQQFSELEPSHHPTILEPRKKYHFGKLYNNLFELWRNMSSEVKVEFDLLYDMVGWDTILCHQNIFKKRFLYIHQGGLLGNETMLARYERKIKGTSK